MAAFNSPPFRTRRSSDKTAHRSLAASSGYTESLPNSRFAGAGIITAVVIVRGSVLVL